MVFSLVSATFHSEAPADIFAAGLAAGATEAVAVVTPMEVVKIRLQAQQRKP